LTAYLTENRVIHSAARKWNSGETTPDGVPGRQE
jgi:hypothetical protein